MCVWATQVCPVLPARAASGASRWVSHRMSGRARDGRLVHFTPGAAAPRPGDVVETVVTYAAPHYLVADSEPLTWRRTKAGDRSEAGLKPKTAGVGLGLPSFGAPAPLPAVSGCAAQ